MPDENVVPQKSIPLQYAKRFAQLARHGKMPEPDSKGLAVVVQISDARRASACLKLLLEHTDVSAQIVAVPDNRAVAEIQAQFQTDRKLEFVRYETGVDLLNRALTFIQTPFIALLTDRVMVGSQWSTRLIWPFFDDDTVGITAPLSTAELPNGYFAAPLHSLEELQAFSLDGSNTEEELWSSTPVLTGPCLLFRRAVLEQIGGLDSKLLNLASQTADWCLRARQHGYTLALCRDTYVHVLHEMSADESEPIEQEWQPFCRKWNIASLDHQLSGVTGLDIQHAKLQPNISLCAADLEPALVTVVCVSGWADTEEERMQWIQSLQQQSYPHTEWLWIRLKKPAASAEPASAFSISDKPPIAEIAIHDRSCLPAVLASTGLIARGKYMVYACMEHPLGSTDLESIVEALRRGRWDLVMQTPLGGDTQIPLLLTAHAKSEDVLNSLRFETKDESARPSLRIAGPSLRAGVWRVDCNDTTASF